MNNLNSILIEGNLTQDPDLSTIPSGKSVCRFNIASNRYYRNAEKALISEVSYVQIATWGSLAEVCSKHLYKGRGVRVVGRLKQDRWVGEDEKMHEKFVVVAEHVEFHPEKKNDKQEEVVSQLEEEADMVFEEVSEMQKKKK